MDQTWFEMPEIRRRTYSGATWVPIYAIGVGGSSGDPGHLGYKEEFFGLGSLAVPIAAKPATEKLGWSDVGISHNASGWVQNGVYTPANIYSHYGGAVDGEFIVLNQGFDSGEQHEWHLSQDLVITLGLKREGDVWVRPNEGYIEVARLSRTLEGAPKLLEIRSAHLRDYLCARGMALYLTSYRSRTEITSSDEHIKWEKGFSAETTGMDSWEGRVIAIHEGGMRYGEQVAILHMSRTDVDPDEDAPTMDLPSDDSVVMKKTTRKFEGKKLFQTTGQFWRNEWIEPSQDSPIVRGDKVAPTVFFITSPAGSKESRDTLVGGEGRWLWFRPEVISALLRWRGSSLSWYTKDTGNVSCSPGSGAHFGVNSLGLVNVYAKDIGLLPDWQQQIWAGHNVSPEGKVSPELLASQVKATPANTQAPETYLPLGLELLNKLSLKRLSISIIRPHEQTTKLLQNIHRFRATDNAGLFALAKDVARVTAESFDIGALQSVAKPPKDVKLGSLKSLQLVLATLISENEAKRMMGPLFGVYDLRGADAHLPGEDTGKAFELLGINRELPVVMQGYQLLSECVSCIYSICGVLRDMEKTKDPNQPS